MRITADALVTSLLRYGLGTYGSGAYEQCLRKIDTCVVNVVARKVLGVGRSARLPILHATAGAQAMRNLYTQRCAELVDAALRASASSIQNRLKTWKP